MSTMRAKMYVVSVQQYKNETSGEVVQETVSFSAVAKSGPYGPDGSDEDNTFAKWTPSATAQFSIMNPALHGKFKVGDKFYVDFTPAP